MDTAGLVVERCLLHTVQDCGGDRSLRLQRPFLLPVFLPHFITLILFLNVEGVLGCQRSSAETTDSLQLARARLFQTTKP